MENKAKKVLIVAGGGGHFAAALAVIEVLPKSRDVVLVGRKHVFEGDSALSLEYLTATKRNIPFIPLITGRIQRKFTRHTLLSLAKLPIGFGQALTILLKEKPDIIVSFGGYVAVPIVLVAAALNIPIVLHEQTLGAGVSNKIAAWFAQTICISWQNSARFFPGEKTVLTGNPIRTFATSTSFVKKIILDVEKEKKPLLYITGGSGGSHIINSVVGGCIEKLLEKFFVVHQTGDAKEYRDFEQLTLLKDSLPQSLRNRYQIVRYIDEADVLPLLKIATIVVSRSGINTVSELLYCKTPSLFIPLPYAGRGEQKENALFFTSFGFGDLLEQRDLNPTSLYAKIMDMYDNRAVYKENAKKTGVIIPHDAAEKVKKIILDVLDKKYAKKD